MKVGERVGAEVGPKILTVKESCIIACITASEGDYAKDYEDYSGHFEVSIVTLGPPTI
jgi:hypothetical protein